RPGRALLLRGAQQAVDADPVVRADAARARAVRGRLGTSVGADVRALERARCAAARRRPRPARRRRLRSPRDAPRARRPAGERGRARARAGVAHVTTEFSVLLPVYAGDSAP